MKNNKEHHSHLGNMRFLKINKKIIKKESKPLQCTTTYPMDFHYKHKQLTCNIGLSVARRNATTCNKQHFKSINDVPSPSK